MDLKSFWSLLKRGFDDPKLIFFHMQKKFYVSHLDTLFRLFR